MRMHSTVPVFSRRLTKPMMIDGIEFPAGSAIDINIHALNHHPDSWPDHMEFRPERFLLDNRADRDPFVFVPFSAGSRNCIGQNFAMNEQKVLISRLVHKFQVDLDPSHEVVEMPEVVMRAKYGIKIKVTPRN
jgi:cytochrome P450